MEQTTQSPQQNKGKTIFKRYSTWGKGQHYMVVQQMLPGEPHKPVIARVFLEGEKGNWQHVAKSADGKEVLFSSNKRLDVEKHLTENGYELAMAEMQKYLERKKVTPSVEAEKPEPTKDQDLISEVDEIRPKRDSKDKGITR